MYRKAIELDPSDATAHSNLGALLGTARKDYDGAEAMFQKAIELDPSDARAHNNLNVLLKARKDDAVNRKQLA
jgi:Flp pilus assembly protein TadD